jgi:hypothetical protein
MPRRSHAANKACNRRCEGLLREVEMLGALALAVNANYECVRALPSLSSIPHLLSTHAPPASLARKCVATCCMRACLLASRLLLTPYWG